MNHITIDYSFLTVFEACYIMKNFGGYCDGDKHCIVIS